MEGKKKRIGNAGGSFKGSICILAVMVLFVLASAAWPAETVQAKAKITSKCAKAYAAKLNKVNAQWNHLWGSAVIIRDMNGDKTLELLVNPKPYGSCGAPWEVYTYRNGKVKQIGKLSGTIYKISGKKKEYKTESWAGVGVCSYNKVVFSSKKISAKSNCSYEGWPTKYYIKGKKTSKKKYDAYLVKFKKNMVSKNEIISVDLDRLWTAAAVKANVQ